MPKVQETVKIIPFIAIAALWQHEVHDLGKSFISRSTKMLKD